jgi:phospholipase/lecithinase/hemolysin
MQFQTLSGSSTMLLLLLLAPVSICQASSWDLSKFSTLVAFGDSYSDDARLDYFREHQGQAPPPGWVNPVVSTTI